MDVNQTQLQYLGERRGLLMEVSNKYHFDYSVED